MGIRIEGLEALIKAAVKEALAELLAESPGYLMAPTPGHAASQPNADDLLTTAEAAKEVGLSKATLEKLRVTGGGPPYRRLSARCIRYRRGSCRDWVEARAARNTGEATVGGDASHG